MKTIPFLGAASLLLAAALFSGCASIVYAPANGDLNDPDSSGCDAQALEDALVKSCRHLSEGKPVPSAPPFSGVERHATLAAPYKLADKPNLLSQFFFEFTPLGFLSPIFDYPPRGTVFTGRVRGDVSLASGGKVPADFEFRVNAGEEFTSPLRSTPPATAAVRCRSRGCELTIR